MGIHQKILEIQKEIKSISKDGKIETKVGTYKITSHTHVLKLTRDLFIDRGLVLYPTIYHIQKDGAVTTVNAEYVVVDVETEEKIQVASVGQGSDTQDKGAGKASTYADKYLILRLLRLLQEEDPDLTSSEDMDEKLSETESRGKEAITYLDGLLRDNLVDQTYYDNAKKYLQYFIKNGDLPSIQAAEKEMKKLRG